MVVKTSPIRALDSARDLPSVADLLEEAFQSEMDASGAQAVREMRLVGQWGPLAWLINLAWGDDVGIGPGFVWAEGDEALGSLSLRRATSYSAGWLVGNVAVRQAQRGRGIGRALMQRAIEHVQQNKGDSIRLLVRADNRPATRLYTGLGFRQVGSLAYWRREIHKPRLSQRTSHAQPNWPVPAGLSLRPARSADQTAVYDLANQARPADLDWAEPVRRSDFYVGWDQKLSDGLNGRQRISLVAESAQAVVGAVMALIPARSSEEGQLRVWTRPDYHGQLEMALLGAAISHLGARPATILCAFPAQSTPMYLALARFGFTPVRILAHMRLDLH